METHGEPAQRPIGRRFALPLAATSGFLFAADGGLGLIIKLFLKEQGFAPIVISSVTSVNAVGVMLGSLLWGRLSDRTARKPLLFITMFGVAAAIGLLILLPALPGIFGSTFVRTFMRIGFATMTMAIISGASSVARRGKNLSYVTSSRSLGFALGSMASGFAIEMLGFRGGFALMTFLPLLGMALLVLVPSAGLPTKTMTQAFALIVFGRLADRVRRRRIFMLGFARITCYLALGSQTPPPSAPPIGQRTIRYGSIRTTA